MKRRKNGVGEEIDSMFLKFAPNVMVFSTKCSAISHLMFRMFAPKGKK